MTALPLLRKTFMQLKIVYSPVVGDCLMTPPIQQHKNATINLIFGFV